MIIMMNNWVKSMTCDTLKNIYKHSNPLLKIHLSEINLQNL